MKRDEDKKSGEKKNPLEFYRFGSDMSFFYIYEPFKAFFDLLGKDKAYCSCVGGHGKGYMLIERCRQLVDEFLDSQEEDLEYVDLYIKRWEDADKVKEELINSSDIDTLSKEDLIRLFSDFSDIRYELWKNALITEFMDPIDEEVLESELSKFSIDLDDEEISIIKSPIQNSFQKEYELDLLLRVGKDLDSSARELKEKYYFIKNDWARVVELDYDFFKDEIRRMGNIRIEEKISEIEDYAININPLVESIIQKHNIPRRLRNIIYALRRLSYFRDMRKVSVLKTHHFLSKLIKKAQSFTHHHFDDLLFLTPPEMVSLLKEGKDFSMEIIRRKDSFMYFCEDGDYHIFSGIDARNKIIDIESRFSMQHEELVGRPAFKGIVKGRARIIRGQGDFSKFMRGDIIIAPMTRPEYLPLMQMASAIVTDEGGITSHAAIVSRELMIPCIIGTHMATEIINDGDLIEVDANSGRVRKIGGNGE